jgi:hypothetical protein
MAHREIKASMTFIFTIHIFSINMYFTSRTAVFIFFFVMVFIMMMIMVVVMVIMMFFVMVIVMFIMVMIMVFMTFMTFP